MIYREMISQDAETEIAAKVIGDLLCLLPPDKRAGALAIATAAEHAERQEREKHGRFPIRSLDELTESWKGSVSQRHWNAIMRFKARVAYTFIRNIYE